jgi:hypothetical protein
MKPGGNSGVYCKIARNQVFDGDKPNTAWAVINESESPYRLYNGVGKWNAYDIVFRAAIQGRQTRGKAMVTMYFNGKRPTNFEINQVWGGPRLRHRWRQRRRQRHH